MGLFRKRPVIIEARELTRHTLDDVAKWCGTSTVSTFLSKDEVFMRIDTLEGVMEAKEGDYIIRGVAGEFYPCKPDIFELTYEPLEIKSRNLDTEYIYDGFYHE